MAVMMDYEMEMTKVEMKASQKIDSSVYPKDMKKADM